MLLGNLTIAIGSVAAEVLKSWESTLCPIESPSKQSIKVWFQTQRSRVFRGNARIERIYTLVASPCLGTM